MAFIVLLLPPAAHSIGTNILIWAQDSLRKDVGLWNRGQKTQSHSVLIYLLLFPIALQSLYDEPKTNTHSDDARQNGEREISLQLAPLTSRDRMPA